MSELQGKVFQVHYRDRNAVYNSFMSFTKDGGLFVPSAAACVMGEMVHLIVKLPDSAGEFMLSSRICWISHGRRKGFGVLFSGDEGSKRAKVAVENMLGTLLASPNPTYTM